MNNKNTVIKFLRNSTVYEDINQAFEELNNLNHFVGQPVISYYLNELGKIECIFAIGKKDGTGKDSYSIISSKGEIFVNKIILGELPDITELKKNSLILCRIPSTNKNYWVTLEDNKRVVSELIDDVYLKVKDLTTNEEWWVNNQDLKKCSDYNTREEFNDIKNLSERVNNVLGEKVIPKQEYLEQELNKVIQNTIRLTINIDTVNSQASDYVSGYVHPIGQILNVVYNVTARFGEEDVTTKCIWKISRETKEDIYQKIEEPNELGNLILDNCSTSEKITLYAYYQEGIDIMPDEETLSSMLSTKKEFSIIFALNTIIGKIQYIDKNRLNQGKSLIDFFGWNELDVMNSINDSTTTTKNYITRTENDQLIFIDSFEVYEYLFIAIPENYKLFSDIIDSTTNQSILEEFDLLGGDFSSPITLKRDEAGNEERYIVYLKKSGIMSNKKKLKIIFKP